MWSDLQQHIIKNHQKELESETAIFSLFLLQHTLSKRLFGIFSDAIINDLENFNDLASDVLYDFFTSWCHAEDLFNGASWFVLEMILSTFMNKEDYTLVTDYGYYNDFCSYDYEDGHRVIENKLEYNRKIDKAINDVIFDFVDIPDIIASCDNDLPLAMEDLSGYEYTVAYIKFKNKSLGRKLRKNPNFNALLGEIGMVLTNGIPLFCLARNIEYDPYSWVNTSLNKIMSPIELIRKDLNICHTNKISNILMKQLEEHDNYSEENPYTYLFQKIILKQEVESKTTPEKEKLQLLNPQIIALGQRNCLIKQEEHEKIVTFQGKAYKIKMPNSLYFIYFSDYGSEMKINEITAFSYKDWLKERTKLFRYPMPNMLGGNRICMGSAPKRITDNDYVKALENIIFTQYTHSTFSDVKGFKNTVDWFEYLEKNEFPYDLLISLRKTLKSELGG